MEAPEKLYLHPTAKGKVGASWLTFPLTNEDVEYTRTDAFIEKACAKLKKLMYDSLMFQGRLHQEEIIERFIEDFKNHMKG
jgi:hypothetical protein